VSIFFRFFLLPGFAVHPCGHLHFLQFDHLLHKPLDATVLEYVHWLFFSPLLGQHHGFSPIHQAHFISGYTRALDQREHPPCSQLNDGWMVPKQSYCPSE